MKPLFYQAYCLLPAPVAAELNSESDWCLQQSRPSNYETSVTCGLSQFQDVFSAETWMKVSALSLNVCIPGQKRFMPDWQSGYWLPSPSCPQNRALELGMNWLMDLRLCASIVAHPSDPRKTFC